MDNKKIHAILLNIANRLKLVYKWKISPDYEIELQQNKISLLARYIKDEVVGGAIDVSVSLHLAPLKTGVYPLYDIYANIAVEGAASHDIESNSDADVEFNDTNFNNTSLYISAADQISANVKQLINREYSNYIEQNADSIQNYHDSGDAKADNTED